MTESAHYEQLLRRNQLLADEVARLHRLLAAAEDELAERRARGRRDQQAAGRYLAAWQSARRRAAAAEARLAELEESAEPWYNPFAGPYLQLFDLCNDYGAAFGDGAKSSFALAIEKERQRELVAARIAEYLAANPVPGVDGYQPPAIKPPPAFTFDNMATLINEYRMPEYITEAQP